MFSRKTRASEVSYEIIYPGEAFTWREDETIRLQRRGRARQWQIGATCLGLALAVIVVGHALGIFWLFTAVASAGMK
jgi:hypothetical protein